MEPEEEKKNRALSPERSHRLNRPISMSKIMGVGSKGRLSKGVTLIRSLRRGRERRVKEDREYVAMEVKTYVPRRLKVW